MPKWRDSIWSQHRQSAPEWSLPPLWPLHLRHTWEMIIDMMRILRFTWLQVMIHNDQHIMMAGQKYSSKLYFMAIQFHNWRLTSLSGVDWLPPRQRERGQPESSESKSTWALESSESWYRTIPDVIRHLQCTVFKYSFKVKNDRWRCTKTHLKINFKMYSKISRGKPSHQLKEKNEKAEYHSWSVSLLTTAAEKILEKRCHTTTGLESGWLALKLFLNI